MEGKNPQKSIIESKFFKIPIEEYEKDMETESNEGKKNEILDLLNNFNKLRSEEEFNEIKDELHIACREGDVDLIKIYLSETVEDTNGLQFNIDSTNRTASLFKVENDIKEVIIPRTVEHESVEYLITSINRISCHIKKLKFVENSAVETIYRNAFLYSRINEIYFPISLKELKEGWCHFVEIRISPSNGQFKIEEDKYLIGKSDSNKDEFDSLLFACRDIKEISIPSNIKIISSHAFQHCEDLTKVEIPSNIKIISSYAFNDCKNLTKVEIPPNSNLQTIGSCAFSETKIKEIFIPSKVSKICKSAFFVCKNLTKVEIPTNSNLQTIEKYAFKNSKIEEFYFPSSLKELKEGWCCDIYNLTKIRISPSNG